MESVFGHLLFFIYLNVLELYPVACRYYDKNSDGDVGEVNRDQT